VNNYTDNDTFEFGVEQENNYENVDVFNTEVFDADLDESNAENQNNTFNDNSFVTPYSKGVLDETKEDLVSKSNNTESLDADFKHTEFNLGDEEFVSAESDETMDVETLEDKDNSFDKKTEELANEINSPEKKIQMSEEDLSSLTTFDEDKVETTDIKSLFDRVGINVKEASDVFKRNTEMKEKIDLRFEELKKLQLDVARKKEEQYAEINAYKEDVLSKLTEKKEEIERRLNKLKEYQVSLEKEKEEFEQYRKKEKEEIEKVQREVQEAYDSRREELNHIEDVLRHQKDLLDEERSQLNLDKIQYESDKNELANNLLKFNEIVDSFTNGIDKLDKE
jgi:DNA repair exonuclease SbcCD ATPase subunit